MKIITKPCYCKLCFCCQGTSLWGKTDGSQRVTGPDYMVVTSKFPNCIPAIFHKAQNMEMSTTVQQSNVLWTFCSSGLSVTIAEMDLSNFQFAKRNFITACRYITVDNVITNTISPVTVEGCWCMESRNLTLYPVRSTQ